MTSLISNGGTNKEVARRLEFELAKHHIEDQQEYLTNKYFIG
jgi:hypothetical protein